MTLREFAEEQVKAVEDRARLLRLWERLHPGQELALEIMAQKQIDTITLLRGVSVNELVWEVWNPGSFRKVQLG